MNALRERAAVIAWVDGSLSPGIARTLTFLHGRPYGHGRIQWSVFACWYPDAPVYRVYSRTSLSRNEESLLRGDVLRLRLPRGVPNTWDRSRARSAHDTFAVISRKRSVPLGMYVTGHFYQPGETVPYQAVSALWCSPLLPVAYAMEQLKLGARG